MGYFSYEDYLRISDEIKLNKLASQIDITLILNDFQIDNYDMDLCLDKVMELELMYEDVLALESLAAFHKNHEVYDMCEVYRIEIQHQVNRLRKRYIKLENN